MDQTQPGIVLDRRYPGTAYAVAESINDVTGLFNERSITYNGSLSD